MPSDCQCSSDCTVVKKVVEVIDNEVATRRIELLQEEVENLRGSNQLLARELKNARKSKKDIVKELKKTLDKV